MEPLDTVSAVPLVFWLRLSPLRTFTPRVKTVLSPMGADSITSSQLSAKPPPIAPVTALIMPIILSS